MAAKLIVFVVESDISNQSDNRYIKKLLERRYDFSLNDVTIKYVNMGGKGNYKSAKTKKKIKELISLNKAVPSYIIYCFDTDNINSNIDEKNIFEEELKYCVNNNFSLIWFNYNIEYVLLGCDVEKIRKRMKL